MERDDEILTLWRKTDKNGKPYYSGKLNGQAVTVFLQKDDEKRPAVRIVKAKKREDASEPGF